MRSTFAERGLFGTAPREAIADRGLPTGGSAVEDRRGSIADRGLPTGGSAVEDRRGSIADRGLPTGGSAVEDRRSSIAKVPPAPKTVPNAAPETGQAR